MTDGTALMSALRQLAMPVVVVSAQQGDEVSCATSTAMYVALSPILLTVSLRPGSRTCRLVVESGELVLSLLSADQVAIAERAAQRTSAADKFAELDIAKWPAPDGRTAPGVALATAVIWCRVVETRSVGDYLEILAQAEESAVGDAEQAPLLRHRRHYIRAGEPVGSLAADGYPL
jgi:flavin reductase (DIM6/NTAB) family NADH-FMN oxidoreductase RutF